jgi:hypothetical protein
VRPAAPAGAVLAREVDLDAQAARRLEADELPWTSVVCESPVRTTKYASTAST